MKNTSRLVPILALLAIAAPIGGAIADSDSIPYVLGKDAMFEAGCLPPCMCPVLLRARLSGTFTLVRGPFDGFYQHYEVQDVDWRLSGDTESHRVTGKGMYKVGGEVAVQHQLTLDLSVDGDPLQRYDSGLVAGGGQFPRIEVPVALNGFFCHDSVYGVQAHPAVAGVIPTSKSDLRLRASPNPFGQQTQIDFAVSTAGRVELRIYDVSGRQIRALVQGRSFEVGTYAVTWDGRRDDGARAPAGVYFVGLKVGAGGRETRGRLVRF
jgi:hypothetical protein